MSHSLTHAGSESLSSAPRFRRYGYTYVTAILFLVALAGHWWLGWRAYLADQAEHGAAAQVADFIVLTGRDTLENWQSEFLQLIWQVAGLAYLLHVGSPQSREGNERLEAKIDALLRAVDGDAEATIRALDAIYDRND
jgi:hypothetical protein